MRPTQVARDLLYRADGSQVAPGRSDLLAPLESAAFAALPIRNVARWMLRSCAPKPTVRRPIHARSHRRRFVAVCGSLPPPGHGPRSTTCNSHVPSACTRARCAAPAHRVEAPWQDGSLGVPTAHAATWCAVVGGLPILIRLAARRTSGNVVLTICQSCALISALTTSKRSTVRLEHLLTFTVVIGENTPIGGEHLTVPAPSPRSREGRSKDPHYAGPSTPCRLGTCRCKPTRPYRRAADLQNRRRCEYIRHLYGCAGAERGDHKCILWGKGETQFGDSYSYLLVACEGRPSSSASVIGRTRSLHLRFRAWSAESEGKHRTIPPTSDANNNCHRRAPAPGSV